MKSLIIIILVVVASTTSTYFIPTLKTNWFEAHEFCNSLELELVSVTSKTDHDKLIKFIKESKKFSDTARFWLGARDLGEHGTYSWISTGKMVTFTNGSAKRPNYADPNGQCRELIYWPLLNWDWTWINRNCHGDKFYFICEKPNKQNCIEQF